MYLIGKRKKCFQIVYQNKVPREREKKLLNCVIVEYALKLAYDFAPLGNMHITTADLTSHMGYPQLSNVQCRWVIAIFTFNTESSIW